MSNSEKILKTISNLIENGILTSQDVRKEISTDLKFKKDCSKTRSHYKKIRKKKS